MVNNVYIAVYIYFGILGVLIMSYKYFFKLDFDDNTDINDNEYNTYNLNRMLFHERQHNNNENKWMIKKRLYYNLNLIKRESNELFNRIVTKFKTFTRRAAYSKVPETDIEQDIEENRAYFNYDNKNGVL